MDDFGGGAGGDEDDEFDVEGGEAESGDAAAAVSEDEDIFSLSHEELPASQKSYLHGNTQFKNQPENSTSPLTAGL